MSDTPPIPCMYDGEAFVPAKRFVRICDKHFTIGEIYTLVEHHDRSAASHRHYFASIHEAWMNLHEGMGGEFATPEHLRKFCLIRTGYRDQRTIVAASKAEAMRLAAFIRPMDEYAIVTVEGALVTVHTAQSQSMKAMGKKVFQQSKQDVLDHLAGMIGVEPEALSRHAEAA